MTKSTATKASAAKTVKKDASRSSSKKAPTRSAKTATPRAKAAKASDAGRLEHVKASVKHAIENAEHGVEIVADKVTDTLHAHKGAKAKK